MASGLPPQAHGPDNSPADSGIVAFSESTLGASREPVQVIEDILNLALPTHADVIWEIVRPVVYMLWDTVQESTIIQPDTKSYLLNAVIKRGGEIPHEGDEAKLQFDRPAQLSGLDLFRYILGILTEIDDQFSARYTAYYSIKDLNMCIAVTKLLLDCTFSKNTAILANHAINLSRRFEVSGDVLDLEEAIRLKRRDVELTPNDHRSMPFSLNSLGSSLQARYDRFGEISDIEEAIQVKRRAVDLTPAGHGEMSWHLSTLGDSLLSSYNRTGDLSVLEEAVAISIRAVEITPKDHHGKATNLSALGASLHARFKRLGSPTDLDEAIAAKRGSVDMTPDSSPRKGSRLSNLGISLQLRFDRYDNLSDLEEAIATIRRAVELMPETHPDRPQILMNLGNCLESRFDQVGNVSDLDEAVVLKRLAIEITPEGHPDRPGRLSDLGNALSRDFSRRDTLQNLEEAIDFIRNAVNLIPDDHPEKPYALNNLGFSIKTRFDRLGSIPDIEEAVSVIRTSVDLAPEEHFDKALFLNNLGNALQARFDRTGVIADLDDAVAAQRSAVDATPDGHPSRSGRLNDLGNALEVRFGRFRALVDVEEAIAMKRLAVESAPNTHHYKPISLNNLASSLHSHFRRTGSDSDLEEAVTMMRRAVNFIPDNSPRRPGLLCNLAIVLMARFDHIGERLDFDEAVVTIRHAVDLTADGHPDKPWLLNTLGSFLQARFSQFGNYSELEDAILARRRAVDLTPDGHAEKSSLLNNLGLSLRLKLEHLPEIATFKSAFTCFSTVACATAGSPAIIFGSATEAVNLCTDFPDFVDSDETLLTAHGYVLDAIPPFIWIGESISDRYATLSNYRIGEHITAAASAAIAANKPELALEWLEAGRSIIWGQLNSLRSPLDELRDVDSDLADQFQRVSTALETAGRRSTDVYTIHSDALHANVPQFDSAPSRTSLEEEARIHRKLAADYKQLLSQIRQIDGLENFLRAKKLAELAPACRESFVAVINVHYTRCDALILCAPGNVIHLPLPRLSLKTVHDIRSLLTTSLQGRDVRLRNEDRGMRKGQRTRGDMSKALRTLWLTVVEPVVEKLKPEFVKAGVVNRLPHITWCATGPLSFLPLHAAGIYGGSASASSGPSKLSDIAVSSYTPSLSALADLFRRQSRTKDMANMNPRILVVSQSEAPDLPPLPCTVAEAAKIREHFPHSSTHLDGEYATAGKVFDMIKGHEWVHLACHAIQAAGDPTKSAFYLADDKLELSRLMGLSHTNAELAVLSACQTAKGSDELPEEAAHLSAGMLAAGFKSVIATMWSIADEDGPTLSDALYEALKHNLVTGGKVHAAYALHEAVEKLKSGMSENDFARWVPFIHSGI